ncbi:MAG: alanine--tRNA ligase [candidate division WOR-3 bacterium]
MFDSHKLRESYLKFFEEKGHKIVPSSSLIPKDDPTLLFTTAGMVQFKPYYSGAVPLSFRRAASCQKCLRVTDLEKVGKTLRHHTFFEMLGNFSFGDYFKEEAIEWAWEFLIEVLGMNKERLFVSVYYEDEESFKIWNKKIGLDEKRIYRLGKEDNFWGPAGKTGACGPSTEIYYDLGEEFGCGKESCAPGCDCDRFIEFWNLVFPQYDMQEDGTLLPLKNRGVDTGMGLERTLLILQDKKSNYETDVFYPIIKELEKIFNRPYRSAKISFNVIADHIRALAFAISDGVYPSNFGRGYVLRKILRRALRFSQKFEFEEPFLYKLVPSVAKIFENVYPEVYEKKEFAGVLIKSEEERFLNTLSKNLVYLREVIEISKNKGIIEGKDIFKLYDTYGFPVDFIEEYAEDEDLKLDIKGFEEELQRQREISKKEEVFVDLGGKWIVFKELKTEFVGYYLNECEAEIIKYRERKDGKYEIVLDKTPFYPEGGGQIGDSGILENDGFLFIVNDTKWFFDDIVHIGELKKGKIENIKVKAKIDLNKRAGCKRAHTATHLLHNTLREFLGEHVRQEGSVVEPDRLRFDFTHFEKISENILKKIENYINEKIRENRKVNWEYKKFKEAKEEGAIALFGEKYGEIVRVVEIEGFSKELCGGTHVNFTGEIGLFKIIKEEGIGGGIRRIEAFTGEKAFEFFQERDRIVKELSQIFISPAENLISKLEKFKKEKDEIEKEKEKIEDLLAQKVFESLNPIKIKDFEIYIENLPFLNLKTLKKVSDRIFLKNKEKKFSFLIGEEKGRVVFFTRIGKELIPYIKAKEIVKKFCDFTGAKGGGDEEKGEGGGGDRNKIKEGIEILIKKIREKIK